MSKKYSVDQKGLVEICTAIKEIPIEKQPYYHMELASLGTQERKKSGRSVDQIRMYWSIVEALMYYTNTGIVDKDVMHQYLKEVYASTHESSKYFHRIKHSNGKTRLICTFAVGTQSAIDFSNCS